MQGVTGVQTSAVPICGMGVLLGEAAEDGIRENPGGLRCKPVRSEERRGGEEGWSRGAPDQ